MREAMQGDTVRIHYTGKLDDGTVFDSSTGREPLEFTIGQEQVIPGFEKAVVGMQPGQSRTTTIVPDEGYGPYQDEMVFEVDRDRLPGDMEPEVGMELRVRTPDDMMIPVVIVDVNEDKITIDANHPLAGRDLTFDIELVEIVSKIITR
ncbi:MAG TPA: peptidylprolyl isomerase [Candidatus Kapabacteria bacterium]|nr:peptidylprolyl isomerase [Candidatus Kapabacteria bacterium]